ncbi:GNAT family protein [Amycolatopsis sp.]|jgi:RimJ/RimL family protein N-acetyltransferase|uniref:GNAT family N-acetyltransferase n=1 Tax=Amycolatopsis sp. TaxID=37632 RepID=UPI002E0227B6|nr:GNAT family protein [Amycolatopsis sp.]
MLNVDLLRDQPVLHGERVLLTQLDETFFDEAWAALGDEESRRFTHTHAEFTPEQVREFLRTRPGREDRADWAILVEGRYVGEVVLMDLDVVNESIGFRIALASAAVFGRGFGTDAVRVVLDFAFGRLGVHRVGLDVADYNPRARRVYEKCGFVVEGVLRDAILWEGKRYDSVLMSVLGTDPR